MRLRSRTPTARRKTKAALAAASGISDEETLNHLVELKIGPDTLTALTLFPLVEVAWADDRMEEKERRAILNAAKERGVAEAAANLLENWLNEKPSDSVRSAWYEYIDALTNTMSEERKKALKEDILGQAKAVAEAAGGFLGFGDKISHGEQVALDELEKAFN